MGGKKMEILEIDPLPILLRSAPDSKFLMKTCGIRGKGNLRISVWLDGHQK